MTGQSDEVVMNALRLLEKARTMPDQAAAEYLVPLTSLGQQSGGQEAANAVAAIAELIANLRRKNGTTPENWARATAALEAWRGSLQS